VSVSTKVSVVIVSFNCKNDLKECLKSLQAQDELIEVIIIDNASCDGTYEMLRTEFQNSFKFKIMYIYNNSNVGLSRANNQAISFCSGKYILFLNPDTILKSNIIRTLGSYLDNHPDVGVIGPKILFEDGTPQRSFGSFPSLFFMAISHLLPSYRYLYQYLGRLFACKTVNQRDALPKERDVDWVSAACMMIRKDLALQLGGFDENIFLSYADSPEICRRVKQMGYRVVYYPETEIVHKQGKSITDNIRLPVLLYAHQGWLYYFKKYHGITSTIILRSIFFLSSLEKAVTACLLSLVKPSQYWPIFKAHFLAMFKILSLSIPKKKTQT